jgi:3-deoxy-manno-octulosonate cytidylyltransferase (CMP-KDO synthetase)
VVRVGGMVWRMLLAQRASRFQPGAERQRCPGILGPTIIAEGPPEWSRSAASHSFSVARADAGLRPVGGTGLGICVGSHGGEGAGMMAEGFSCLVVIPARHGSTRFPGKPLHAVAGKPLVRHVWERCMRVRGAAGVVIATDDDRIAEVVRGFGAEVEMTRDDHPSGTDRLAEVAGRDGRHTHFLNVQGDEPLIDPVLLDGMIGAMRADPGLPMITAASPLSEDAEADNPNVVKVVVTTSGEALYFSRSRIPYARNAAALPCYRHLGVYGYSRDFLLQFVAWPPSPLERTESLEQLRALENGARIRIQFTREESPGVDTPEQAREVERLILGR